MKCNISVNVSTKKPQIYIPNPNDLKKRPMEFNVVGPQCKTERMWSNCRKLIATNTSEKKSSVPIVSRI